MQKIVDEEQNYELISGQWDKGSPFDKGQGLAMQVRVAVRGRLGCMEVFVSAIIIATPFGEFWFRSQHRQLMFNWNLEILTC